jgi:MoaA/NifB/PqqE/SkfB family radical SAM enzyme
MDNYLKDSNIDLEKYELKIPLPSYCCFSITMKCLMSCKTCYIWKQKVDFSKELSIKKWMEVVKYLPELLDRVIDIIVTGGEPLLKEDILDLIAFCSRMGYKISLQTNAFLIDEELAKKLADAGLWRIGISLYSLREEIHDFLHGRQGVYKKVLKAIDYLSKFAPSIGINVQTIIMDINLEDIVGMAEWVKKDERLDYILYLAPMFPFGAENSKDWFNREEYRFMWPQDTGKIKTILDELIDRKTYFKKIANSIPQLKIFKEYFSHSLMDNETNCTLGSRGLNVDPEGNVFLCFSQPSIGNIRENRFSDIWSSRRAEDTRLQMNNCKKKCHFLINCSFNEADLRE